MLEHNICGDISWIGFCDEVYGKKRGRRIEGDTWWWNEEVQEVVSQKKGAHKVMCWNNIEENNRRYLSMKNKSEKAVSKAMSEG